MNIRDALMNEELGLRLTNGEKWLFYKKSDNGCWHVYKRPKGLRYTQVLYNGLDEEEAVRILLATWR